MSSELELMWAAGFWDGEGCAWISREGRPSLTITQINRENLERFRLAVGHGNIRGPYGGGRENHRQHYQWRTSGRRATKVIALLLEHVSTEKRQQFRRCTSAQIDAGQISLGVEVG